MRVEILKEARQDLVDGFRFYERQSKGLGDYFLDSLFSDLIPSTSSPESILSAVVITAFCQSGFLSPFSTASRTRLPECAPSWTAAVTRHGFGSA